MGRFVDANVNSLIVDSLRIMMPNRAFATCVALTAGIIFSGNFDPYISIIGALMIISTYSSQAIFNNLKDIDGDKTNSPDRPLVNGSLSINYARNLMYFLIIIGYIFAAIIGPLFIIANTFFIFIGQIYSSYTKSKWYLSYFTLATSHIVTPFTLGYVFFLGFDIKIFIIIIFLYLTEMLVWSIKDYKDVKGDEETGVITLPVHYKENAAKITFFSLSLPLFLGWLPWIILNLSTAFIVIYFVAGLLRVHLGHKLLENQSAVASATVLKNFRLVLFLQMIGWCLA